MEIFFEVFESLPRQGPGNRACTRRALELCRNLPPAPRLLDLGCGVGAQTLHLASLTDGTITAIDSHAPIIERLQTTIKERQLSDRITAEIGDMNDLPFPPASFDLIWSEGALYNLGLATALPLCRELLRPGGYLAFTDAVWRTDKPPAEAAAAFADYATMGTAEDAVAVIEQSGLLLVHHFTLPDEAWWEDFYSPMLVRIDTLRTIYAGDAEALAALDEIAKEPAMHRRHGDSYGYEFFVTRRPG